MEFITLMNVGPAKNEQYERLKDRAVNRKGEGGRAEQRQMKVKKQSEPELAASNAITAAFPTSEFHTPDASAQVHHQHLEAQREYQRDNISKLEKVIMLKKEMGMDVREDQAQLLHRAQLQGLTVGCLAGRHGQ